MEPNKDLRISTMTLISQISTNINLMKLYENLESNDTFKFIQFGNNPVKGNIVKKVKNPRKKKETKYFYNQLTLHILNEKIINVKVFNNGGIQMTGLKREEQGNNTIQILLQYFKNLPTNKKEERESTTPEIVRTPNWYVREREAGGIGFRVRIYQRKSGLGPGDEANTKKHRLE